MRHYKWEGLNHVGLKTQGEIEAFSTQIAKAELRKQGVFMLRIHQKRNLIMSKKITAHDISLFSRQMATMLHAGLPLIQSFDIVSKSLNHQRMKNLIASIKKNVASGLTLAESLRIHPAFFNSLFCNLVDAGEKSGTLDIMLMKIAAYKEKTDSIKNKIKKTLAYPMTVLLIAWLVSSGLLIFVVPQFQSLFKSFDAELPQLTRVVIQLSQFFQNEWYFIISTVGICLSAFFYYKKHSIKFAHALDKFILKCPIIGPIMENAAIARFTRTLSITFAAGLPLVEALKLVAGATGNILFSNATDSIRNRVSSGQSMHLAMEGTMRFPNMVIQMVAIGEESGTLEKMLNSVADYYEEAVDTSVDTLSSLIEPIIMAVLGLLVGGLVVAMYLPIFKLGSVV